MMRNMFFCILYLFLTTISFVITTSTRTGNMFFVGTFENHQYDEDSKNDWHYVTITFDSASGTYKWSNRAGRLWTLYPSENADELKVGPDCPYYKGGHIVATFANRGVYGPYDEFYNREYGSPLVIGRYENHLYDNSGKNKSHYVTITYDDAVNRYTWENEEGVSWSLHSSAVTNVLRVGRDCPHHKSGHVMAKVTQMGIYGPSNEFYTRTKEHPWFVGKFVSNKFSAKNDWDYVTITYDESSGNYIWKNKAKVSWTLYPTEKDDRLRVGEDCPFYHKKGYTIAKVTYKGILGPLNELYARK